MKDRHSQLPLFIQCPVREHCLGMHEESKFNHKYAWGKFNETWCTGPDHEFKNNKDRCAFGVDHMCPCRGENPAEPTEQEQTKCTKDNGDFFEYCAVSKPEYLMEWSARRCPNTYSGAALTTHLEQATYCRPGSKGPLCAVCSKSYAFVGGSCKKCPDPTARIAILIVAVTFFVCLAIFAFKKLKTLSQEMRNAVRDINRIFVIALTLSQINVAMLSQIRVQFPDGLINFMVAFDFVNFDLPSITGATCDADIGFTGKFLVLLCLPVFVVFFALCAKFHSCSASSSSPSNTAAWNASHTDACFSNPLGCNSSSGSSGTSWSSAKKKENEMGAWVRKEGFVKCQKWGGIYQELRGLDSASADLGLRSEGSSLQLVSWWLPLPLQSGTRPLKQDKVEHHINVHLSNTK